MPVAAERVLTVARFAAMPEARKPATKAGRKALCHCVRCELC